MPTKGGAYGITNIRAGQLTGGSKKYSNATSGQIRGKPLSAGQKEWLKYVKEASKIIKSQHNAPGTLAKGAVMILAKQLRDGK